MEDVEQEKSKLRNRRRNMCNFSNWKFIDMHVMLRGRSMIILQEGAALSKSETVKRTKRIFWKSYRKKRFQVVSVGGLHPCTPP